MTPYRLLDLFSGIGGFSLGLERSGAFKTVAFCEIEPFCRRVLAKHWPKVPCYDDIRDLSAGRLAADGIVADAICGGFPCQDISIAGRGAGISGERSGLWAQYARIIGEIQPRIVIVENVSALLGRGLSRVLGDLATLGYDAEWHCIPASAVGAPHGRDRLWIIADRDKIGRDWSGRYLKSEHVVCDRLQWTAAPFGSWRDVEHWLKSPDANPIWEATDASSGGMDDGVSRGVDSPEIGALGNAVVPQIPELIGRAILAAEGRDIA